MRDVGRLGRVGDEDAVLGDAAIERGEERHESSRRRATSGGRRAARRRGRRAVERSRPRAASPASMAASVAAASPCRPTAAGRCRCSWPASMSTRTSEPAKSGARSAGRVEVVGLAELRADGEHDVGLGEGRVHGPQRERRAEAQRVAVGHDALGVDRQADRRAEPLGDRGGLGAGGHGAAAEQQHRALGRGQQLDGALDERRRRRRGRAPRVPAVAPQAAPGRSSTSIGMPMCTGRGRRDSKISKARANASGSSAGSRTSIDSAVIVAMNARWSGRSCSVPCPRPLSAHGRRAGDHEQRDRVVVGAGDRRRGVRQAGAGDQRADARLAVRRARSRRP